MKNEMIIFNQEDFNKTLNTLTELQRKIVDHMIANNVSIENATEKFMPGDEQLRVAGRKQMIAHIKEKIVFDPNSGIQYDVPNTKRKPNMNIVAESSTTSRNLHHAWYCGGDELNNKIIEILSANNAMLSMRNITERVNLMMSSDIANFIQDKKKRNDLIVLYMTETRVAVANVAKEHKRLSALSDDALHELFFVPFTESSLQIRIKHLAGATMRRLFIASILNINTGHSVKTYTFNEEAFKTLEPAAYERWIKNNQ